MSERTCKIPRCVSPVSARGWCGVHYQRWYRHGDPEAGSAYFVPDAELRFWSKVDANGVCWEWTGAKNSIGYGCFTSDGVRVVAHRYAYGLLVGSCPPELDLDHLCRNRACVNPDHLEPVTHKVNVLRGGSFAALNALKTHCPRGHEYSPENTRNEKYGGRRCLTCERARKRKATA